MISALSLAHCLPWNNSISLTWHTFGCISWGERIWQQLLSSETWEPETEVLFLFIFHFPSSWLIPITTTTPPPRRTLSSCFRDGVVMFCEGTAHTSTENKHYSCFSFLGNPPYHRVHPPVCLTLELLLFFHHPSPSHSLEWWSHTSKRRTHRALSSLHEATRRGGRGLLFYCETVLCPACQVCFL